MLHCFFMEYLGNDDCLDPLDALFPKIPFSFFAEFWVGSPPGPWGQCRQDLGGPSIQPFWGGGLGGFWPEGCIDPPPLPQVESPFTQGTSGFVLATDSVGCAAVRFGPALLCHRLPLGG